MAAFCFQSFVVTNVFSMLKFSGGGIFRFRIQIQQKRFGLRSSIRIKDDSQILFLINHIKVVGEGAFIPPSFFLHCLKLVYSMGS